MNISLKILLVYMGLNFLGIFLSAVFGIWFLTSGILWLFFMGAVFLWPFWWLIEIIKFGDIISIFGFVNLICFAQNIVLIGILYFITKNNKDQE
ncbi:MAG: hypothetical protein SPH77_06105 [Campylobacter sp.]|uniref:hypothetical protein n=1 Tax=Campylobacter sp. TaxID=205 RepID=UPI002A58EA03|nr:hypothetical protein [Campylobacter sp.]MDD7090071.1 hypothetical protein [Campylobacteraceae bacterium]MCI6178480.1 hypothetical protein [Campylobacter sp.]MDY3245263.1 hypothetical protein [Campylobacter sp.]MDY5285290.1 hypothetical protein [Campylobacter sp.]MDY5384865.1 hypothetical protein [Campylobacter sp.]